MHARSSDHLIASIVSSPAAVAASGECNDCIDNNGDDTTENSAIITTALLHQQQHYETVRLNPTSHKALVVLY
jgi:hypothetical protein